MVQHIGIGSGYDKEHDKYFIEIENHDNVDSSTGQRTNMRVYLSADSYRDFANNMILLVDKNNKK
jgi:hypothetical protein